MTKQQFYNLIARKADTPTQKIDASISSRVTKLVLDELRNLKGRDIFFILHK